ncbi:MAG: hypothetical protein CHACPFDD_00619 [Phycisphaerae bacterium]|nr:hypothetical protein [Phycisphaerae bacterium]
MSTLANVGTPLMWGTLCFLTVGNALIGWLEGSLIARWFGSRRRTAVLAMVLANYLSAVVGIMLLSLPVVRDWVEDTITIEHVWFWHAVMIVGLYVLTVVLEWPCCIIACGGRRRPLRDGMYASLGASGVSYVLLALLSLPVSALTPGLTIAVDRVEHVAGGARGWVYYLSEKSDVLWRVRLDGSRHERVADVSIGEPECLCVRPSESGDGRVDLMAWYRTSGESTLLLRSFAPRGCTAPECGLQSAGEGRMDVPWAHPFGGMADLRPAEARDWEIQAGFWAVEGLRARRRSSGARVYLGVETPITNWWVRFPSALPGGVVVLQLGRQICVLNLERRSMALLARGGSPLVVLDEPTVTASRPASSE